MPTKPVAPVKKTASVVVLSTLPPDSGTTHSLTNESAEACRALTPGASRDVGTSTEIVPGADGPPAARGLTVTRGPPARSRDRVSVVASYAAFLRGMNVGGHRVTNEELRARFAAMGFSGVATFRASGNVVFAGGAEPPTRCRVAHRAGARWLRLATRSRRSYARSGRCGRSRWRSRFDCGAGDRVGGQAASRAAHGLVPRRRRERMRCCWRAMRTRSRSARASSTGSRAPASSTSALDMKTIGRLLGPDDDAHEGHDRAACRQALPLKALRTPATAPHGRGADRLRWRAREELVLVDPAVAPGTQPVRQSGVQRDADGVARYLDRPPSLVALLRASVERDAARQRSWRWAGRRSATASCGSARRAWRAACARRGVAAATAWRSAWRTASTGCSRSSARSCWARWWCR